MPKLNIIAPCDNVLIGPDNSTASLIVIMASIQFPKPPKEMPLGAVGPMRWFIFCNWVTEPDEAGKTYEQRIRFGPPDKPFFESVQEMTIEVGKQHHRMVAQLNVFPLADAGTYLINADWREKGQMEWKEGGNYPLLVEHKEAAE